MARHKDANWSLGPGTRQPDGTTAHPADDIKISLLMDLRDELKELNRTMHSLNNLLHCPNVLSGFRAIARIDKRVAKKLPLRGR